MSRVPKETHAQDTSPHRKPKKTTGEENTVSVVAPISGASVLALRQRGEKELTTSDERRLSIRIIESKCMGAESCVIVAPSVFALDVKQLGLFRKGNEPLGVKDVADRTVGSETIILAAKSCPFKAI
ncbi:ferredoxin [Candidatus Bathyarchaeota archaeon]|nr:MAG: ferredoxin [Candidatus Bathyarchaeota archaeon]